MQEQLNLARYLASFRTLFIPSRARNNVPQRMKKTLPVCAFTRQDTLFIGCQVLEFSVPLRQLVHEKLRFKRIIRQGIER